MLGRIRKLIRTANRPLSQACRRIHEMNYINKSISVTQTVILKQQVCQNYIRIFKLNYKGFTLSTKTPDNYVLLKNDLIIQIIDLLCHSQQNNIFEIKGQIWNKTKSTYTYPINSKHLKEWKLASNVSSTKISCNLDDIISKIIIIPVISIIDKKEIKEFYASALLHAIEY